MGKDKIRCYEELMKKGLIDRRTFLKLTGMAAGAAAAGTMWPANQVFAAAPKYGGDLRAAITGWSVVNTLDPAKAGLNSEFQILWGMFNCLVRFDQDMNIVPDLAKSWETPDDRTYLFHLHQGIKFHDGNECTADDVKFSLERVMDPATASPHKAKLERVEKITAVDKYTAKIVTKEAFAPLLTYLGNARTGTQIVSRKAVEKYGDDFMSNPVGTGPFQFVEWKPGEGVYTKKFKDYFMKGLPYLDGVDFLLIPEESTGTTGILGGDIDVTSTALFSDVSVLERSKGARVLKSPGLNCRMIVINNKAKPFDDLYVRQAFVHAYDREALVKAVIFGEGVPSQGLVPRAIKWAYDPTLQVQSFNPPKARALLAKSRYKKEEIEISILAWGAGWWKRWAEIVASLATEVLGVKVKVEIFESGTVYTRLREHNFQCSVWGWLGLVEPDEYLYLNFHTQGSKNYSQYSNPRVDDLLDKARMTLDRDKRAGYYHEVERIVGEEAVNGFCFNSNVHNILRDNVKGFVQIPFSAFGQQFDKTWLE
jgi:peptide/nickel transport system substrate-binding protein